jgi:cytochrome b561
MKPMVETRSRVARPKYGAVAMLFHWLLALSIVAALALGWFMTGLPFSPSRLKLYNWHKWLGMSILLLTALRLLWRLRHPAPPLPAWMARRERLLAHAGHGLMYLLFFAVPLIGWARSSAAGFPIVYLGLLQFPDLVGKDKALAASLTQAHAVGAYLLAVLVVLHLTAVFKHAVVGRDGILARMLPDPFIIKKDP